MQAIGRQPQRAPDGTPVHYERHRSEQTTLCRLVQQHAAAFFTQAEDAAGADLPQFVKDKFVASLECGILAHGFLRLHCGDCGHDKLVAFSCKPRGFCPSCGARRMARTAAHLADHVIPNVPVRPWVLSLPIPLRLLLAAQPKLLTSVLQVVQRVVTRHLGGHLIRLHGVLAPNAKLRALEVPRGPDVEEQAAVASECKAETAQDQGRAHRISWTRLLKRVFNIDIQHCPNCGGGELKIIAPILERQRPVIEKILTPWASIRNRCPGGRAREAGQDFAA